MKLLALILLAVGVARASSPSWQWQSGKDHVFEYSGRILSGFPKINNQYVGLGIKADVVFQVKSLEDIRMTLRNVSYSHVNERLSTPSTSSLEGSNWRHVIMPGYTPATHETSELLRLPVIFSVKDSEIKSIKVSNIESEWSLNFKKAIIGQFQAKMEKSSLDLEMNMINKDTFEPKTYWKVSEESIEGVCDVIYQVNELPKSFTKENRDMFPRVESCPSEKYFEIIKTKSVESCRKGSFYTFLKPAPTNPSCTTPECMSKMFGTISSISRFYACGSRSTLMIQSVQTEGETNTNMMGSKSEYSVTGSLQTFRLKHLETSRKEVPIPSQPRRVESLMYEYVNKGDVLRSQLGLVPKLPQSEIKDSIIYKYLPRQFLPTPSGQETKEKLNPEKVKSEMKKLIHEIIEEILSPEKLTKKNVPMKIVSLVRGFTLLPVGEIKSLYSELKTVYTSEKLRPIFQNIYFDSVVVSGTTPAVLFIKEMIRSEEMTKVQATSALMLLPHHIITPTKDVFSSLFELLQSEVIVKSHILQSTAILGYSNLVQKACLDGGRKFNYPTQVFGEFCDPQSEVVVEKWIPYLNKMLRTTDSEEKRNVIVVALGILSHKDVIPTLLPLIESSPVSRPQYIPREDFEYRNATRYLAVYSLVSSGTKHPELVLPITYSIFNNPSENSEIRIAAFNVLIKLNPPMIYLQNIASSTWSEKDVQVLRTVYTTIYTLSKSEEISSVETSSPVTTSLPRKCSVILPLMKKVSGYLTSSASLYTSTNLPLLNVGSTSQLSWINNYNSRIPSDIFLRTEYFIGNYNFKPYEFAFKLHGAETLLERIGEILRPLSSRMGSEIENELSSELKHLKRERKLEHELEDELEREQSRKYSAGGRYTTESRRRTLEEEEEYLKTKESKLNRGSLFTSKKEYLREMEKLKTEEHVLNIKKHLNKEWTKVIDHLKLEVRKNGPLTSLIYMNFFDDVSFFGSINEITTTIIEEKIHPLMKSYLRSYTSMCKHIPLNFQRIINIAPTEFLIPSPMGFPINFEVNMPITASVTGKMEPICNLEKPGVVLDAKIMLNGMYQGTIGTYNPFTKESLVSGFTKELLINLPTETRILFDVMSNKLKINFKPYTTHEPIDIIHASTVPFTATKSYYSLRPIVESPYYKVIKSVEPLRKVETPFGTPFGMNFKAIVESETRYLDMAYIVEVAKMYKYNPLNMIEFLFSPFASVGNHPVEPTLRRNSFKIQYDPTNSRTKEIEFTLKFGMATKTTEGETRYYNFLVKTPEELRREPLFLKKYCPYGMESRPISEQVHPVRQEILKKFVEKLELKSGYGFVINFSTVLKGSRPSTFTYQAVWGGGMDVNSKAKCTLHLESEPSSPSMRQKICIDSVAEIPSIPIWDIEMLRTTKLGFNFKSIIGFGKNCEQSKIVTTGATKVSQKHRVMLKESPVAKKCQKLVEQQVPGALTSTVCEETRLLAKTLNEFDLKIQYIRTSPTFKAIEHKLSEILKFVLLPYIRESTPFVPTISELDETREVHVSLIFDKSVDTVDILLNRPEETIKFKNVHVAYPLNLFVPIVIGESNTVKGLQYLTGHTYSPRCNVEKTWLRTYDNRSLPLKLDDCFHLVTGDCSTSLSFGVLARSMKHSLTKEVKIFLNKTEVLLTPTSSYSKYVKDIKIFVNGTELYLEKDMTKVVREESGELVGKFYRTKDGVIKMYAPYYNLEVLFDGERLSTQSTGSMKNKLCGICGDYNHQKIADVKGPKKCIYSKPEVEIASYRVSTPHCSPLEGSIKEKLETETKRCATYTEIPTEVFKSFIALVGKCTKHEHMILERTGELCFSRLPVTQCGAQCSPKPRQLVSKKVSFTCLKKGRVAELYRKKIIQGIQLPELESQHESFVTNILSPQSCVSVTTGYPMISNSGIPTLVPTGSNIPSGNKVTGSTSTTTNGSGSHMTEHGRGY